MGGGRVVNRELLSLLGRLAETIKCCCDLPPKLLFSLENCWFLSSPSEDLPMDILKGSENVQTYRVSLRGNTKSLVAGPSVPLSFQSASYTPNSTSLRLFTERKFVRGGVGIGSHPTPISSLTMESC